MSRGAFKKFLKMFWDFGLGSSVIDAATVIDTLTFNEFEGNFLVSRLNQETDALVAQLWILTIQLIGPLSDVVPSPSH